MFFIWNNQICQLKTVQGKNFVSDIDNNPIVGNINQYTLIDYFHRLSKTLYVVYIKSKGYLFNGGFIETDDVFKYLRNYFPHSYIKYLDMLKFEKFILFDGHVVYRDENANFVLYNGYSIRYDIDKYLLPKNRHSYIGFKIMSRTLIDKSHLPLKLTRICFDKIIPYCRGTCLNYRRSEDGRYNLPGVIYKIYFVYDDIVLAFVNIYFSGTIGSKRKTFLRLCCLTTLSELNKHKDAKLGVRKFVDKFFHDNLPKDEGYDKLKIEKQKIKAKMEATKKQYRYMLERSFGLNY